MPRVFVSPELSLAIDPPLFELLFRTFGRPAALPKPKRLDADAVARALFGGEVPDALAAALALLAMLAHARGRDAFREAEADAREQGHFADGKIDRALAAAGAPAAEWRRMVPEELALRLVVARAKEEALETVFERAQHRLARSLPAQIPYELAARASPGASVGGLASTARADLVAEAVRAAAEVESAWADAWTAHDDDGGLVVAVLRADAPEGGCVVDVLGAPKSAKGSRAPRREVRHALAVDLIRLHPDAPRVTITTSRPQLAFAYGAAIGTATSGDPHALVDRPALTLKKLQVLGHAGLRKLAMPRPVTGVVVVALQLDDLRGLRSESRGARALADVEPKLRAGGYLVRATLRFTIEGAPHDVDAYVELPNRLSVSDPRFERPVRAALGALGVFRPGAYGDTFLTLAPWVHPGWRWRETVGAIVFDALVRAKLLVPAPASETGARLAGEADRSLAGNLRGFPLKNARDRGRYYAVAVDWAVRARTAAARELSMHKLDMAARRARLRAAMDLGDGPKIALPKGVADIGRLAVGGAGGVGLRFVEIVRAVGAGEKKRLARAIRVAVGRDHAVVLVPEGTTLGRVLIEIELDVARQLGIGDYGDVVLRAAKGLRVEGDLAPWRFATRSAPMVIVREREEVWLGRVDLKVTDNQLAMLHALGVLDGKAMRGTALGEKISPGAVDLAQVVHNTRRDFVKRVERSFREAGVELPEEWTGDKLVVSAGSRSYRLGVGCVVR